MQGLQTTQSVTKACSLNTWPQEVTTSSSTCDHLGRPPAQSGLAWPGRHARIGREAGAVAATNATPTSRVRAIKECRHNLVNVLSRQLLRNAVQEGQV